MNSEDEEGDNDAETKTHTTLRVIAETKIRNSLESICMTLWTLAFFVSGIKSGVSEPNGALDTGEKYRPPILIGTSHMTKSIQLENGKKVRNT